MLGCRQESIRTAFLLSQGGEFAFVLLSLANELKVLPTDLNRLLIIVVVLSMALTPFLAEAGKRFAESTVEEGTDGEALFDVCLWHHQFPATLSLSRRAVSTAQLSTYMRAYAKPIVATF